MSDFDPAKHTKKVPDAPAVSKAELLRCIETLEGITESSLVLTQLAQEERIRLLKAAGKVVYPERESIREYRKNTRKIRKKANREEERRTDQKIRACALIRDLRSARTEFQTDLSQGSPRPGILSRSRSCYICKAEYETLHFFYDSLCVKCADYNYRKRSQTASLKGQTALITGGRVKIGYYTALILLRAGATVIVTTRFPRDAAKRFSNEADFQTWSDRLQIYGLDLRHPPSVEAFARHLIGTLDGLDILINNAAQTVRRPPQFYSHLLDAEIESLEKLSEGARSILVQYEKCRAELTQENTLRGLSSEDSDRLASFVGLDSPSILSQKFLPTDLNQSPSYFPVGRLDVDLQQVDERLMNSWRMKLNEVPSSELLEVLLVNTTAPFILCRDLKPLMVRNSLFKKHVINVTAMEGKFHRVYKSDTHPHTNMAKAALNMMTLTSAKDFLRDGIYMNAVDTGWVTDEDPALISAYKQEKLDFYPPLDVVDGAARICDPIFSGLINGEYHSGKFLKDYSPTDW